MRLDYASGPAVGNVYASVSDGAVALTVRSSRKHVLHNAMQVATLLILLGGGAALYHFVEQRYQYGMARESALIYAAFAALVLLQPGVRMVNALHPLHLEANRERVRVSARTCSGLQQQEWRAEQIADIYGVVVSGSHHAEAMAVQLRTKDGVVHGLGVGTREESEFIAKHLRQGLGLAEKVDPPAGQTAAP